MVKAKKHLGQHFLTDVRIAENIANAITVETPSILEVGPGTGVLTQFLIQKNAEIYAYEIDNESVNYLKQHYPQKNLHIKEENFLTADLQKDIPSDFVVCGNFPYNISTEIVFKVIENRNQIPQMVGMFQKEVAERICAKSGNKTYGITSVITQLYYETEYLFTVTPEVFNPPPKVDSGVMRMNRKENTPTVDEHLFKKVVKQAFSQRRKKLSNALKSMGIAQGLENHKFLNLRAEQLSVEDFVELTRFYE